MKEFEAVFNEREAGCGRRQGKEFLFRWRFLRRRDERERGYGLYFVEEGEIMRGMVRDGTCGKPVFENDENNLA